MSVTFGMTFTRDQAEPRLIIAPEMATVGLVGTAPGASAAYYPLNEPVKIYSNDPIALSSLGLDGGTLPDAVRGINDQLVQFQAAVEIIVVRVAKGETDDETIANLIGAQASYTGIYALLLAGPDLAKIPRLIGVPGFTHQTRSGITGLTLTSGGSGYAQETTTAAITGGGGTGATADVTVTDGEVTAVTMTDLGTGYTSAPTVTITDSADPAGTGATVIASYGQLANPLCAALPAVLAQLDAHAVVEGPGTNETAIKAWRETLNSQRLIPIDCWVKVREGTETVARPGTPRVLGIGVGVDFEHDGAPMHSWANRPIYGIEGFVRNVPFSLTDAATEGQSLLASNIGIGVRGELGVEAAVSSSGFIFIGTDNAGDDELWRFYNVTRGRDYIHLGLLRGLRVFLGRNNIEGHVIQAILNSAQSFLTSLEAGHHILGSRVGFEPDRNDPENIRAGRFRFFFQAEEPPVLRRLDVDSRRYRPALDELVSNLLASTAPVA